MILTVWSGQLGWARATDANRTPATADCKTVRRLGKLRRVCIQSSQGGFNSFQNCSMHSSDLACGRHLCLDGRFQGIATFMKSFVRQMCTAILCVGMPPGAPVSDAVAQGACKLTDVGSGTAAGIRDARTVLLADGRELRLAGIEVTDSSRGALQTLVGDRNLRLKQLGPERDRYDRLVAFAFIDGGEQSVQETMLKDGQARVSVRIGNKACAEMLLSAERSARASRRGLWANPNFAPLRPENIDRIAAARGQFALVEGKVLSVRESGATIYLNFGRRWTQDFTVTILKRHRREFASAGIDPKRLEGRPIRVRGWIEERGGPVIEVAAPEQIELAD